MNPCVSVASTVRPRLKYNVPGLARRWTRGSDFIKALYVRGSKIRASAALRSSSVDKLK
jgi:hypothetical protein